MTGDGFMFELLRQSGRPVPTMRRPRDEYDDTFVSGRPVPPARGRRLSRAGGASLRCDFSGAAISGGTLAVATLHLNREGNLSLDAVRSRVMTLTGRSQASLENFYHEVQLFFFENGIRSVVLRGAPGKGPYSSGALTYKIEAVLQLADMLSVEIIPSSRIAPWIHRSRPALPSPQGGLSHAHQKVQSGAIQAAAFVECAGRDLNSSSILKGLLDA